MRPYLFVFFAFLVLLASPARAGTVVPGTGCDTDVWSVMGARAWMEGKSDLEAAQTLMLHPASVLQLSCFSNVRARAMATPASIAGTPLLIPGFVCNQMASVWLAARCTNADPVNFRKMSENAMADPRTDFVACNADRPKWQAALAAANPVPRIPAASGGMDKNLTFLNLRSDSAPFNTGGCAALTPIKTGLKVYMRGVAQGPYLNPSGPVIQSYEDAVCPSPDCNYNPAGTGTCE